MAQDRESRMKRLWQWIQRLPALWAGVLIVAVAVAIGGAGLYMYETYDFVQHDNEFCLTCHLMEEPYERFAQSAHRDLGCKACHQPTFAARTAMALTQVTENPDSLSAHAEVPNERCAECHIEGDPEKWRIIENTAGHEVHLASDDPSLAGLQCVECHATSIHEFAPTNRTCGQADCHPDVRVELGRMGQLTIHCVACHEFAQPVDETAGTGELAASGPLAPQREECLSCHQMRQMLGDLPDDEPHGAQCGLCHNPHEQTRPEDAIATCTNSGCHARADTIDTFHHQRASIDLQACANCHRAHTFRVDEENCLSCHEDIFRGERIGAAESPRGHEAAGAEASPFVHVSAAVKTRPESEATVPAATPGAAEEEGTP